MNGEYTSRVGALLGTDGQLRLKQSCGVIFGVGGVGSWCAEALIRTGIGKLVLIDDDIVAPSNVNRQRQAQPSTVGESKTDALKAILLAIAPDAKITAIRRRYTPETAEEFTDIIKNADFMIDAIDSVDCKADLMARCARPNMPPLFCSMGAALRTDPTRIQTSAFPDVAGDGLAKALRNRFRKAGIPFPRHICVHSTEAPAECNERASLMQVTCAFGMALAALAVNAAAADR